MKEAKWFIGLRKKVIVRSNNDPYLTRYTLFNCPWFSIKVHKVSSSDDYCLHDHPWAFVSLILKGGYVEHSRFSMDDPIVCRRYRPLNLLFRPAKWTHRLEVTKTCWTFVVTFKKIREWGFHTPFGWVPWFNYREEGFCD
jgi:hypothetical protein